MCFDRRLLTFNAVNKKGSKFSSAAFRSRLLMLGLSGLFVASFFMPAYSGGSGPLNGWNCMWVCLEALADSGALAVRVYYFGFVIMNFVFSTVLVRSVYRPWRSYPRSVGSLIALGYVFSWWVVNLVGISQEVGSFYYGYFAWLLAYCGLAIVSFSLPELPKAAPAPS